MKIALGTVQFGLPYGIANSQGQVSHDEVGRILAYAQQRGVDTLDTAIAYGNSEQRLGEIGAQSWRVISKLPALPEDCIDVDAWVSSSVQGSIQRLNCNSLYGLLLHRPQNLLEGKGEQLYGAMQRLKHEGLVAKIGVSIYDPSELDGLCSRYRLDMVQAPFNLMDRRLIDSGWMVQLKKQDTELHVRSVFLQGLLLMSASDRPSKFGRWRLLWAKYDAWLKDADMSPLQACIGFAMFFSEISKVVIGVDSLSQLKEILHAADSGMPLVPEDIQSSDIELLNPARWNQL